MYRHTHLRRRMGRNTPTAVVHMDLPPHPSANRFRRTVATERVEQMVRREGELEERVPQGVRRGWGVVEIRYVAAIVFMCYVLELHSLCFNTQLYMHPGASLLVQV